MTHHIHDKTFKRLMGDKAFFVQLCRVYLPEDISRQINWESVKLSQLSGESVTGLDRAQRADGVHECRYQDGKAGLFLTHFEHQSRPDGLLALRLLSYAGALLLDYAKMHKTEQLPVLIQLVYYHGKATPYPYSLDFYDSFVDKALAKQYLLKPILVDLGQHSDEEISTHGLIAPAEVSFKYFYHKRLPDRQISLLIQLIRDNFSSDEVSDILKIVIEYNFARWEDDAHRLEAKLVSELPAKEQRKMKTVLEQLMDRGRQQGRQQGMQQGMQKGMAEGLEKMARGLLRQQVSVDVISRASGMSVDALKNLLRNEELVA